MKEKNIKKNNNNKEIKEKTFLEKDFSVYGFKFNTKNTLFGVAVAIGVFAILLLLDNTIAQISWYGVIIGCAFLVALFVAINLAQFRGLNTDFIYELLWWIFPLSIIGARAYYVIFNKVPLFWEGFEIWNGGVAIYGGIIGGALGALICCLIRKKNVVKAFDIIAPALAIAQAIGRWGNFVNQELYGFEVVNSKLKWFPFAVFIENTNQWHLALFFYESLWNTIWFFILVAICRKCKLTGLNTCVYLVAYGICRYFLEGLREDVGTFILKTRSDFPVSKLVSIICVVAGAIGIVSILIYNAIKGKNERKNFEENK